MLLICNQTVWVLTPPSWPDCDLWPRHGRLWRWDELSLVSPAESPFLIDSTRLWTQSWWIFRTRARSPAQPANSYRAALTNLCRCINRSQAAPTRPLFLLSLEKKRPNKQARERRAQCSLCRLKGRLQKEASFTYLPSRFVWFCLAFFIYAFIYFSPNSPIRRNPTGYIFTYYCFSHYISRASSPHRLILLWNKTDFNWTLKWRFLWSKTSRVQYSVEL